MKARGQSSGRARLMVMSIAFLVLLGGSGCQTFSLTKEEWENQQQGRYADPETAGAVGFLGSFGALGAAFTGLGR